MAPLLYEVTSGFTGFALCVVGNDKVLLTGGILNGAYPRDAQLLDTVKGKWDQLPRFHKARRNHASISTSKAALIFGGDYGCKKLALFEELQFDPQLEINLKGLSWS